MIVYLSEYIHPDAIAKLKAQVDIVDTWDRIEEIDGIILRTAEVNREIMQKGKKLKIIGKHGVGCNTIDLDAAKELGIPVFNTPTANMNAVAELIVGLMLNISRKIAVCDRNCTAGVYTTIASPETTGIELSGKTVGLIGTGNIARRTGKILKNGFGCRLIGFDPYCTTKEAEEYGIFKYEKLTDMISASDIINISVPLTSSTENMIAKNEFTYFKKNAILVNAARGGIVNEHDLYDALKEGKLRAAACDSFVQEPPTKENKLLTLDNFCATPHIGANSEESLYRMGMEVVEGVLNTLNGKKVKNQVV